jgi:hypothetical protein
MGRQHLHFRMQAEGSCRYVDFADALSRTETPYGKLPTHPFMQRSVFLYAAPVLVKAWKLHNHAAPGSLLSL